MTVAALAWAQDKGQRWVWRLGFEMERDYLEGIFRISGNANSHVVHNPEISPSQIVQIDLDRRKDQVPYRTELEPKDLPAPYFEEGHFAMMDQEYWYGLSVFLPKDWQYDTYPEIIMQWNSKPDPGEQWRYPPVAVRIESSDEKTARRNYQLYVFADARKLTVPLEDLKLYSLVENYDLGPIEQDLGKWTDWIYHIKWSYKGEGFIEIWKNGQLCFSKKDMSNTYNDAVGPFFKFGIYKWNWNPDEKVVAPISEVTRRRLYFDDLRVGAGQVELKDMLRTEKLPEAAK